MEYPTVDPLKDAKLAAPSCNEGNKEKCEGRGCKQSLRLESITPLRTQQPVACWHKHQSDTHLTSALAAYSTLSCQSHSNSVSSSPSSLGAFSCPQLRVPSHRLRAIRLQRPPRGPWLAQMQDRARHEGRSRGVAGLTGQRTCQREVCIRLPWLHWRAGGACP